jgi:hypothetical protein
MVRRANRLPRTPLNGPQMIQQKKRIHLIQFICGKWAAYWETTSFKDLDSLYDFLNTSIHKNFSNFLNKLVNVSLTKWYNNYPHPSIHKVVNKVVTLNSAWRIVK